MTSNPEPTDKNQPVSEPPEPAPPASTETPMAEPTDAEAFAAQLTKMTGIKCPTLMPSVATGLLEELYRNRWLEGRRAVRDAIRKDKGKPTDWAQVCCLSGVPILRDARVRVFLLVREEWWSDARDQAGYGSRYFEHWRHVGLPLLARYRYADNGFVAVKQDAAWRCLRTYFRQRYGLRLKVGTVLEQLDAAGVGRKPIEYPSPLGGGARAWFCVTYALEPAYRWLVTRMAVGGEGCFDRRRLRVHWQEWFRRPQIEINPRLPYADDGDNAGSLLVALGIEDRPATTNAPYTDDPGLFGCLPLSPYPFAGCPFGLGPALLAARRGDRAALRALMDCKLAFAGLRALGLVLHPRGQGEMFTACELGGRPAGLKGELVKWARAHWRRIGAPVRKPDEVA